MENAGLCVSGEIKNKIIEFYFGDEFLSASETAEKLQLKKSSVRNTIDTYKYSVLTQEQRDDLKERKDQKKSNGVNNPSHKAWLKRQQLLK